MSLLVDVTTAKRRPRPAFVMATLVAGLALAGCATADVDDSLNQTNREAAGVTGGKLALVRSDDERRSRERLGAELLKSPLPQADAVQLALANSPSVQALLAQHWAKARWPMNGLARSANRRASTPRVPGPCPQASKCKSVNPLVTPGTE